MSGINIIIWYVMVFGVTGAFFVVLYGAVSDGIERAASDAEYDAARRALQMGERLRGIDVIPGTAVTPTVIDVMNTGESDIMIWHVLVDGRPDPAYEARYMSNGTLAGSVLAKNEIIRITPDRTGDTIVILTQTEKAYRFGG